MFVLKQPKNQSINSLTIIYKKHWKRIHNNKEKMMNRNTIKEAKDGTLY